MRQPRFVLAPLTLAALVAASLSGPTQALAQAQPSAASAPMSITIAAQPLGQALNELAQQAELQLLFPPALVAGKTAPAVSGTLTPSQVVDRLLAGSRRDRHARRQCRGHQGGAASERGRDAGAGDGDGAGRARRHHGRHRLLHYAQHQRRDWPEPLAARDAAQSITVVTRQRLDDQNLNSLGQVLAEIPGLSVSGRSGQASTALTPIYSGGYMLSQFQVQVDGAAATLYTGGGWTGFNGIDTANTRPGWTACRRA